MNPEEIVEDVPETLGISVGEEIQHTDGLV